MLSSDFVNSCYVFLYSSPRKLVSCLLYLLHVISVLWKLPKKRMNACVCLLDFGGSCFNCLFVCGQGFFGLGFVFLRKDLLPTHVAWLCCCVYSIYCFCCLWHWKEEPIKTCDVTIQETWTSWKVTVYYPLKATVILLGLEQFQFVSIPGLWVFMILSVFWVLFRDYCISVNTALLSVFCSGNQRGFLASCSCSFF